MADKMIYFTSINIQICDQKLNETIVKFQKYINNLETCGCPDEQDKLCAKCREHWVYVEEHLQNVKCQLIHCPLWCVYTYAHI